MPATIGNVADPALQPAAAAARPTEVGTAAAKKALDQQELEGRQAVQLINDAGAAASPQDPAQREAKGRNVDRTA